MGCTRCGAHDAVLAMQCGTHAVCTACDDMRNANCRAIYLSALALATDSALAPSVFRRRDALQRRAIARERVPSEDLAAAASPMSKASSPNDSGSGESLRRRSLAKTVDDWEAASVELGLPPLPEDRVEREVWVALPAFLEPGALDATCALRGYDRPLTEAFVL